MRYRRSRYWHSWQSRHRNPRATHHLFILLDLGHEDLLDRLLSLLTKRAVDSAEVSVCSLQSSSPFYTVFVTLQGDETIPRRTIHSLGSVVLALLTY